MLVNAANFPGPALWQGLMFCVLPLFVWGAYYRDGRYFWPATICYAVFGVALFVAIVMFIPHTR